MAKIKTQTITKTTIGISVASALMVSISVSALSFTGGLLAVLSANSVIYSTPTTSVQYSASKKIIIEYTLDEKPLLKEWRLLEKKKAKNLITQGKMTSDFQQKKNRIDNKYDAIHSKVINALVARGKNVSSTPLKNVFFGEIIDGVSLSEAKSILWSMPEIVSIHEDFEVKLHMNETNSLIGSTRVRPLAQGGECNPALGECYDGEGVVIAVIDTGVDYRHESFGSCASTNNINLGTCPKVIGGFDFSSNDANPMDSQGHGTHVAGVAAGDGQDYLGVAPKAKILAFRTGGDTLSGTAIFNSIDRAADPNQDGDFSDRADILNMSFGSFGDPDDIFSEKIDAAVDAGFIVVVSAGNSGPKNVNADPSCWHDTTNLNSPANNNDGIVENGSWNSVCSPASARNAIAVAATYDENFGQYKPHGEPTEVDKVANFSSRGPMIWRDSAGVRQEIAKPDISAPGPLLCSSRWSGEAAPTNCVSENPRYAEFSGTSAAAPVISGVAALILQKHPDWKPLDVKKAILETANDISNVAGINQTPAMRGAGRVNVVAALAYGVDDIEPPQVVITAPKDNSMVSGNFSIVAEAIDDVGVKHVEFYFDGSTLIDIAEGSPYTVRWDTRLTTSGNHTLSAIAFDLADHSTRSSVVRVTVDNIPPEISLLAPRLRDKVSGNAVVLEASATDNQSISKVEFYINDIVHSAITSSPYKTDFDSTRLEDGVQIIFAKAYDGANNTFETVPIYITVDNTKPTVTITSPAESAIVSGSAVVLSANASDASGVQSLSFYIDSALVGTDNSDPYSVTWNSTSASDSGHVLLVKAIDTAGNFSQPTRNFSVRNNTAQGMFRRGDTNGDTRVNISDAITLLGYLFSGNPKELLCPDAADADDSGSLKITDGIFLLQYLFNPSADSKEIPAPGVLVPGPDPTADSLGC